jgi:hypothetical protein
MSLVTAETELQQGVAEGQAVVQTAHERRDAGAERGHRNLLLYLLELLQLFLSLFASLQTGVRKRRVRRVAKPWNLRIRPRRVVKPANTADVNRLLQRHRDLKDAEKIGALAAGFHTPESDFFADPAQVERLLRRFLEENPPWLHISRVLSGGEEGGAGQSSEPVWREQETREFQDVTLFLPDESWRDQPLASLTQRPARTMQEVWQARLLDQILPPEVLVDRMTRGEVMIPVHNNRRQRLEFRSEERRIETTVRRRVPIPIDIERSEGQGGQLLYFLLDGSASMRGKSGTLALAVITAVVRANMGRGDCRYLFRCYSNQDDLWPSEMELPLQARTVAEKDALLDTIFRTNFNGGATHVNHALQVAATDIENLRRHEHLEASILLVTDGLAEIMESTRTRLHGARIKVHTVMMTPERNDSMEALSESFTALNINPDLPQPERSEPAPLLTPALQPRRAYHI